mmetsp:Transcript_1825/g.2505  ORF Transcript_1825/g.2505 Transcript_1825/m.2505 type:complete len:116 (-) Transcript_1825:77-424(-)
MRDINFIARNKTLAPRVEGPRRPQSVMTNSTHSCASHQDGFVPLPGRKAQFRPSTQNREGLMPQARSAHQRTLSDAAQHVRMERGGRRSSTNLAGNYSAAHLSVGTEGSNKERRN